MLSDTIDSPTDREDVTVLLDGSPVTLPPGHRSLGGIRTYLEALALEQQRILCRFSVDGANFGGRHLPPERFDRVEGESFGLDDMPLQLVRTAAEQTAQAQAEVQSAAELALVNQVQVAREVFWSLTRLLKQPLVTLTFLPDKHWGSSYGTVSVTRLRNWQLQQLGAIIRELDQAAAENDPHALAHALQNRALPWLHNLQSCLELWHETLLGKSGS